MLNDIGWKDRFPRADEAIKPSLTLLNQRKMHAAWSVSMLANVEMLDKKQKTVKRHRLSNSVTSRGAVQLGRHRPCLAAVEHGEASFKSPNRIFLVRTNIAGINGLSEKGG